MSSSRSCRKRDRSTNDYQSLPLHPPTAAPGDASASSKRIVRTSRTHIYETRQGRIQMARLFSDSHQTREGMVEATRFQLMDAAVMVHHYFHYVHLLKSRSTAAELLDRPFIE